MAEQIRLTGAQQTLLGPLHARALDSRRTDPVLGDDAAAQLAARLDFDFSALRLDSGDMMAVVLRAKEIDDRAREFLAAHPDAVVLHLACGLDSRAFRLDLPAEAQWFDVDMPDVVELRDRLYPRVPDNHRTIASSVTETGWLDDIPTGRPTLVIAEGLTPYLAEADGIALLRRLVERFGYGEMLFDVVAPWTVRAAKFSGFLRTTGASFHWGVGDPHDLEIKVPGLHLRGSVPVTTLPGVAKVAPRDRLGKHAVDGFKLRKTGGPDVAGRELGRHPFEAQRAAALFKTHDERLVREAAPHREDQSKLIDISRSGRAEIANVLARDAGDATRGTDHAWETPERDET